MGSSSSKPASKLSLSSKVTSNIVKPSKAPTNSQAQTQAPRQQTASRAATSPQPNRNTNQELGLNQNQSHGRVKGQRPDMPQASETKSRAIIEDSTDPQLLANLAKLGQVQIHRSKQNFKPSDQMLKILKAREGQTAQYENSTKFPNQPRQGADRSSNDLSAQTITALLDERKSVKTMKELKDLAVAYDVDEQTLENLFKYVNSPSIDPESENDREMKLEQVRNRIANSGGNGGNGGDEDDMLVKTNAIWVEPRMREGEIKKLE